MLMGSITAQATPEFAESESFLFIFLAAIGERQGSSTGVRPGFLGAHQGIWVEVVILPVLTEVIREDYRADPRTLESIRYDP